MEIPHSHVNSLETIQCQVTFIALPCDLFFWTLKFRKEHLTCVPPNTLNSQMIPREFFCSEAKDANSFIFLRHLSQCFKKKKPLKISDTPLDQLFSDGTVGGHLLVSPRPVSDCVSPGHTLPSSGTTVQMVNSLNIDLSVPTIQ